MFPQRPGGHLAPRHPLLHPRLTQLPPHQIVPPMRTVLVLLASLAALSACGLRGELERPVPLWGDPPNEGPNDPRTIKAEEDLKAADRAAREERQRAEDAAKAQQQPAPPASPTP